MRLLTLIAVIFPLSIFSQVVMENRGQNMAVGRWIISKGFRLPVRDTICDLLNYNDTAGCKGSVVYRPQDNKVYIKTDTRWVEVPFTSVISETDPVYTASSWYSTINNSSNWNDAYLWGNHATAGYQLLSNKATSFATLDNTLYPTTQAVDNYVTGVTNGIQAQIDSKAPLASPVFIGTPTAPTAIAGTNTTQIATTAFVTNAQALRWGLTGNSSINRSTQFIGTTDNTPLLVRVNNNVRGGFDTVTYDGNGYTGLFSLGNNLSIPTASKSALFISDSARLSGDEFRFGQTTVVTGGKIGGTASQGQMMAGQFEPRIGADNTASWTSNYGMVGVRGSNNIQPGATGTLTHGRSFNAVADYSGMTVTNRYAYYAEKAFIHGTASVTNQYGVYIEAMTGATNNYGLYSLSSNNQIVAGSIPSTLTALSVSGTQSSVAVTQNAVDIQIRGAGSGSNGVRAMNLDFLAGYTGTGSPIALRVNNASAGTSTFTTPSLGGGNYGAQLLETATTTGANIGSASIAGNGSTNIGGYNRSFSPKNSAINIGTLSVGRNSAGSGIGIAGYFTQDTAALSTSVAATVLFDNGNQANAITLWKDAGTTVAQIADGGAMRIGDATTPTDKLEVTGNIALTTAGNKIKIKSGSNASVGSATLVGGTVTVNTTAVTANSQIFCTVQTLGTVSLAKPIAVTTKTAGTSFVITSADATDTSVISWWIIDAN